MLTGHGSRSSERGLSGTAWGRKESELSEVAGLGGILVPLDGSSLAEQAIPYAAALAAAGGELVFFEVTPQAEPVRALTGQITAPAAEVDRAERSAAEAALRDAANRWKGVLPAAPRLEVAEGDPAEEILEGAARLGCGAIVMASHGRGAVARFAFGSVADRVSRASEVPVMIVRPSDARAEIGPVEIRRLIVPLDGSPLAAEALPVAMSLAKPLGIPVHLVQAINPSALVMPTPVGVGSYAGEIYMEIQDELTAAARANLDQAAKTLESGGIVVTTAVIEGPPVLAIEQATEDGDLIVMTSHGRSGFRRWLLGSTAEKLVREGPAPVLLVPSSTRVAAGGDRRQV
jgi:nucleotide-binding universal stress UspA family protein